MINKKTMMDCVRKQLAIDYNCSPDDLLKDELIFTKAFKAKGRRPLPWVTPRLEMITMGNGVVINASEDILPRIREQLKDKTRFEVFCQPFVYGINPYFLPDIGNISPINKPKRFEFELVEKQNISNLYEIIGIPYDANSPRPVMLAILAKYKDNFVGMATSSLESEIMWQIGVDVLAPYRGKGLASALVNMLTLEVLKQGHIPYYSTDCSNVLSQRVAVCAGYFPAWSHCYRTRLDNLL
jgi:GNAT superfamily N-acetyltransferase